MGDIASTTAQKCISGVINSLAHGKQPGPAVLENCEVASRYAKERHPPAPPKEPSPAQAQADKKPAKTRIKRQKKKIHGRHERKESIPETVEKLLVDKTLNPETFRKELLKLEKLIEKKGVLPKGEYLFKYKDPILDPKRLYKYLDPNFLKRLQVTR